MEAKAELRRAIRERLSRMTENDRRVESQIIVRELRKHMPPSPAMIALYSAYMDEPNITPLMTELLEQKNVICLGKTDGHHMTMHRIKSEEEIGRNSVTNIIEPQHEDPVDESMIALAIIPGRAFTKEGLRLGRGNGGYDRWLEEQMKRNSATKTIGVCFGCQLLPKIPIEPHDHPVDMVITADGTF